MGKKPNIEDYNEEFFKPDIEKSGINRYMAKMKFSSEEAEEMFFRLLKDYIKIYPEPDRKDNIKN